MRKWIVGAVSLLVIVLGLATPAQATPFNGAGYYYAGASQTLSGSDSALGWGGSVLVTKPFVPNVTNSSGVYDHAVADIVISQDTTGIAGNTVEAGIAVNRNVWGDFNPHLFACAWHNSVAYSCWTGGADSVDNGANPISLGSDLSADIGTSKAVQVYWANTACGTSSSGVFVFYAGTWVSCYKQSVFGAGWTSSKFFQAFGEYHYNGANNPGTSNDKPNGDLGNGNAPGVGAAYISSVTLAFPSPSTLTTSMTLFTPTDSGAYSAAFTGATTRSIYYGGAGYKFVGGVATLPGNVGS
jgi:hypothetical protein